MTSGSVPVSESDEWNERYGREQVWSGDPNGALVAEVADLAPGRALDVGCGEGADAVWLARRGWAVTALDVSSVALDRAARHAADVGAEVAWLHHGLLDADLPAGGFDLVSAQYPSLRATPGRDAEHALARAVAPGGTLLVVHHVADPEHARAHGFDPADYVSPDDVRDVLGEGWDVHFEPSRPRVVHGGGGAHHTHDVVLRAHRVGAST
ncbi:class I SAM-dependent methyltransferase [Jatrophihabitans sp. YIM 134969]